MTIEIKNTATAEKVAASVAGEDFAELLDELGKADFNTLKGFEAGVIAVLGATGEAGRYLAEENPELAEVFRVLGDAVQPYLTALQTAHADATVGHMLRQMFAAEDAA